MSEVNQIQRASIGWKVLTEVSKIEKTIRYAELGDKIGIHHRAVRFVLGVIQDYCLENQLPPLTILVVNESGTPGDGFIAWDVNNKEEGLKKVYNYNWNNLINPFSYAENGETEEQIVEQLLENPNNSKEIYGKVKVRGTAQNIFRKAILEAYDSKCSFCGLSIKSALQASHIIPWSKSSNSQKLDVRNGLLLCATHHKLFDERIIKISQDYKILVSNIDKNCTKYDKLMLTDLHNKKIYLPKNINHFPDIENIKQHQNGFE